MFLGNVPSNHAAEGATPRNMADLSDHLGVCVEYGPTLTFPGWLVDNIFLDRNFPVTSSLRLETWAYVFIWIFRFDIG